MKRPSIAIIGAGRLGGVLATKLHAAGYPITEIVSRNAPASQARARRVAKGVDARASRLTNVALGADIVWICVPDSQIQGVAKALAAGDWTGTAALHSSGVLISDALGSLRRKGAVVASVHPLMTFARDAALDLTGVPFAMEGDPAAVRAAKSIVRRLGGDPFPIRARSKAAYHAFATMICPLLYALLAASEEAAELAGIPSGEVRQGILPIVRQTISNYERLGADRAFTGPFVRGDVETVRLHLRALSNAPAVRDAYVGLAEAALKFLPNLRATEIRQVLRENARGRGSRRQS